MEKLIVSKYGGSSVTSRSAIEHIGKITSDNKKRKIIVVSAPGKMHKDDTKVTDLLIQLSKNPKNSDLFNKVIEKLYSLGSSDPNIKTILEKRLERTLPPNEFEDSIKAFGEEASARITAQVLGLEYIDPKEIFVFSNDPGNAKILPESKRMTKARLGKLDKTVVIPGFFGYTKNGEIRTLSRGGSDLTGGYLAGILRAEAYENYTDSCILATDPGIVENPSNIRNDI